MEIRVHVMREIAIERGIEVDLAETPEEIESYNPNLQSRTQQAREALGRLCSPCGLREPLGGEKLEIMAQKKYEDAGSAALDASEPAVAARTDVELYRSESERIGDHSSNPRKQKPENSRGKEIQNENDESNDNDEEVMRLASKARVPVNRAQNFAGLREMDLKGKMGQLDSTNEDGDKEDELEEVNEKAITAVVEASKEK
ncbi:uncharacterized protein LOC110029234 isoform X2 [Phalaenopsis equestris]|uniref:uncharacterized protein LOC110029234 isoform X2 n=1 Tax=Phalaenopsis equestris TaxID=78828 RepID=UPI0009E586A2|nr:uncharacterized protein LOC110029234 isoform X2 [Phalaenopsis equestris]